MVTVYIIENSFLIRFALKKIIQSIDKNINVHEMSSIEDLKFPLDLQIPALLILSQRSFHVEKTIEKIKKSGCKTIIVAFDYEIQTNADEMINQNDNPDIIYNKIKKFIFGESNVNSNNLPAKSLSDREIDVLKYVALGLTNKEIAGKLYISAHTVNTHRKNISSKLGIKTIAGFTVYALINHIIPHEDIKKV